MTQLSRTAAGFIVITPTPLLPDGAIDTASIGRMTDFFLHCKRDERHRDEADDLFDAHLPLIRYEQRPRPGLAVRKYVMMKREILSHDTLRKPGAALSALAKAEVDYLLSRVARVDARVKI